MRSYEESLARFGLVPDVGDIPTIRELLREMIASEEREEPETDADLYRLTCVQIFSAGAVEDSLLIWQAKSASFDKMCGVDIQLLCGAGLAPTKQFLAQSGTDVAAEALSYLTECETGGDFAEFSPAAWLDNYREYFATDTVE